MANVPPYVFCATVFSPDTSGIRRFVADADTHQRCYVIEMMGSKSGAHALHSCIGGGGHYAVACGFALVLGLDHHGCCSRKLNTVLCRPEASTRVIDGSALVRLHNIHESVNRVLRVLTLGALPAMPCLS